MPASEDSATCIKSLVLPSSQVMASAAYNFVVKHMHDSTDDMFYWAVSREGNTVTQPAKAIYGQWFVLYGFSAYYAAFRDQHARQLALDCFEALDAAWHNSSTGGYNEWMSNVIPPDPGEPPFEVDPATPLPRTLNVMMHGLEALTALHRVTNDPVVLTRVLEYLSILCTKLQRVGGLLYEAYTPGAAEELWLPATKFPEIKFWNSINYGHNLESTWLVAGTLDYLLSTAAIEPALADTYRSAAMAVGEAAVKVAYDGKYGGVYESGQPDTGPTSTAKAWWTQAESIMALWRVFKHFNNMQYLEKLAATVKFILSYIDDSEYGEQYTQVQADGSHTTEWDTDYYKSTKGNKWKASYHDSRALLFLQNWMKDDMVL